jgi:hypothetical protein
MKIYGSAQYIDNPQVGDLQLEVNSMWDFKARSVCYKDTKRTFGGETVTIPYNLRECIEVKDSFVVGSKPPEPCKETRWKDAEITTEIVKELVDNGYSVGEEFIK